jgi:hypothetical protein
MYAKIHFRMQKIQTLDGSVICCGSHIGFSIKHADLVSTIREQLGKFFILYMWENHDLGTRLEHFKVE